MNTERKSIQIMPFFDIKKKLSGMISQSRSKFKSKDDYAKINDEEIGSQLSKKDQSVSAFKNLNSQEEDLKNEVVLYISDSLTQSEES